MEVRMEPNFGVELLVKHQYVRMVVPMEIAQGSTSLWEYLYSCFLAESTFCSMNLLLVTIFNNAFSSLETDATKMIEILMLRK